MPNPVTAFRMKQIDSKAINTYGIPSLILMENAGKGAANVILRYIFGRPKKKKASVAIFCGKGNNGGDGMVCARHLFYNGITPCVYLLGDKSELKPDTALHLNIIEVMGIRVSQVKSSKDLDKIKRGMRRDIIIDAIFGTGFNGKPEGIYREAIALINSIKSYKFSLDVPSGLNATSGIAEGSCVKADETLTMGLAKTGFYKNMGPYYTGKVKIIDIGLPKEITE